MAEILDNEVITTETINEISTDLGGPEIQFNSNGIFGVDLLNKITGDLVTSGVLIAQNRCECSVSNGKICVNTGTMVFSDGAKKCVTTPIYLDSIPGKTNYIYAKNDASTGEIKLIVSVDAPTGDYIHLATLNADGTITDKRVISKAKVSIFNAENTWNATQTIEFEQNFSSVGQNAITPFSLDVNGDSFKYVIFLPSGATGQGITEFTTQMSVLDVATGKSRCATRQSYGTNNTLGVQEYEDNILMDYNYVATGGDQTKIKLRFVSFEDWKVKLELETTIRNGSSGEYLGTGSISGTLILC